MANTEVIPQKAIDHLLANPTTAKQFDTVFGEGRSREVLSTSKGATIEVPEKADPTLSFAGKVFDSTARAVGFGVQSAVNETIDAFESFDIWASKQLDELGIPSRIQVTNEEGNFDVGLKFFHEVEQGGDLLFGGTTGVKEDAFDVNLVQQPKTITGNLVSGISQFAAGFAGAGKFTKLMGLKGAFVNGAIADAIVFDPKDANVMKMLDDFGFDTGAVGDAFSTDPDDPEYINRLRNVGEGVIFGGVIEAIGWGVKATRALKAGDPKAAAAFSSKQAEAFKDFDDVLKETAKGVADDAQKSIDFAAKHFVDDATDVADEAVDAAKALNPELDGQLKLDLGDTPATPVVGKADTPPVKGRIYITPEKAEKIRLSTALANGTTTAKKMEQLSFRSLTTAENFKDVADELAGTAARLADDFSAIKGGDVQRWKTVRIQAAAALRNMAEMTATDPEALFKRFHTANGGDMTRMAAEIVAQERYIITIMDEFKAMSKVLGDHAAGKPFVLDQFPGINSIDHLKIAAIQRMEVAANVIAGNNSVRSNTARAMNAMKMAKKGDKALRDILQNPDVFRDIDAIVKAVNDPKNIDVPTVKVINATLEKLHGYMESVNTFRINALLSGPGTQEVNIVSNMVNGLLIPIEQALGGIATGNSRMVIHSTRQMQGYVAGLFDSVSTALKAGWWNDAILDPFNGKLEADVDSKATTLGGKVVTLPSRALMTMDEFFKQSQYRGAIFADASHLARDKGLKGEARTAFIKQYIKDSYTETGAATRGLPLMQARRSTFTEPLEPGILTDLQRNAIKYPLVRFFIPFIRTPVNILSQTFQHFPVIGLASKRLKADLNAGGVRASQAIGRQIVGTALVGSAGYLAASGYITGAGPSDPRIRAVWLKNNQPYSFKIPQEDGSIEWVSFARLEPLSNVFSIAADAVEIMNDEFNEAESTMLIQALTIAVMENTVNKTFTQGIHDAMLLVVGGPQSGAAARNFVASFVPNITNQTNGDNTMREVRSMADAILARTGLYNQVDPKRNVLGEPVVRTLPKYDPLGLTHRDLRVQDPVLTEITRMAIKNQSVSENPSRTVGTGPNEVDLAEIPFTENQTVYDRWIELTGTVEIGGKTLRQSLEKMIESKDYKDAPEGNEPGTKGAIIRKVISAYREKAKGSFPELQKIIRDAKTGRAQTLKAEAKRNRELFPVTPGRSQIKPVTKRRKFEDLLKE